MNKNETKVPHDPKVIRYQLNVMPEDGIPKYFWDANTPFPSIVANQELLIEGKTYIVKNVWHDFSWTDSELRCLTSIIVQ